MWFKPYCLVVPQNFLWLEFHMVIFHVHLPNKGDLLLPSQSFCLTRFTRSLRSPSLKASSSLLSVESCTSLYSFDEDASSYSPLPWSLANLGFIFVFIVIKIFIGRIIPNPFKSFLSIIHFQSRQHVFHYSQSRLASSQHMTWTGRWKITSKTKNANLRTFFWETGKY